MAIVINGSGTVTGISVGGLPDDIVDAGTLADDAVGLAQMAAGTDGNVITYDTSGNPAVVATGTSGHFLKSAGAGAVPTFAAGGITEADLWRLTSNFTGDADPIAANLERADTDDFEKIGTGVSHSSGTWSFPSTGLWWVLVNWGVEVDSTADPYMYINYTSDNGSAWSQALKLYAGERDGSVTKMTAGGHQFFNITDVSNDKLQISIAGTGDNVDTMSASDRNWTYFTFIKLGDSQ